MASLASIAHMAPGHGYVRRKPKTDKPYGVKFTTRMNRTHRGGGEKFLWYAFWSFWMALVWFSAGAVYLGHRNVSRMIVYRTEVFGAILVTMGILSVALMGHFIYKARLVSNNWRRHIYFQPQGLFTAVAVHEIYEPDDGNILTTGSYGPKALKVIPKPKQKRQKKKKRGLRGRAESQSSLASARLYVPDVPEPEPEDQVSYPPAYDGYYPQREPVHEVHYAPDVEANQGSLEPRYGYFRPNEQKVPLDDEEDEEDYPYPAIHVVTTPRANFNISNAGITESEL